MDYGLWTMSWKKSLDTIIEISSLLSQTGTVGRAIA